MTQPLSTDNLNTISRTVGAFVKIDKEIASSSFVITLTALFLSSITAAGIISGQIQIINAIGIINIGIIISIIISIISIINS